MKLWLQDNGIEMYSNHNEGKSVFAERFVRTLKKKFTNIDKLDDTVNEDNNRYHRTITMKPINGNPIQDGSLWGCSRMGGVGGGGGGKNAPFLKSVTHILQ